MTAYTATVTVSLKTGVLDPEAETTQQALERLGFELETLRSADRYEVDLDAASTAEAADRAESMAERLLANPTIHDYEVSVAEREVGDDVEATGAEADGETTPADTGESAAGES